jgi:S-DNA-T family DNA segregation ATPase FtsK/SpoIIIE
VVAAVEHPGALPTTFLARCAHRWVLHLHDPIDAAALGATASQVPPAIPGRVFIVAGGMTAQLVEPGRGPTSGLANGRRRVVPRIDIVPAVVPASTLPDGRHGGDMTLLPLGTDFTSGNTCILELPDGEHVMLLGTARSGRSTTLTRLTEAWRSAHPGGRVLAALPRRSLFDHDLADTLLTGPALDLTTLQLPTRTGSSSTPTLVVVDDAELVDDPGGVLASFAAAGHPDHTVVAAGRAEAVRQSYGHWTTVVRRSRIGIVSAGSNDIDGDLIGAVLPRRLPVAPRPGLAWVVQHGVTRLVQVASRPDSTVDGSGARDGQRGPRTSRLATR